MACQRCLVIGTEIQFLNAYVFQMPSSMQFSPVYERYVLSIYVIHLIFLPTDAYRSLYLLI